VREHAPKRPRLFPFKGEKGEGRGGGGGGPGEGHEWERGVVGGSI